MQNDEIKETPDQTSDKNTFKVFDTKPSTCANNNLADPPKKKPNGDITIVSFLLLHLFTNSFKKKISTMYFNKHSLVRKHSI